MYSFLIIPLVNYLALLPAYFAGRPLMDLLKIYIYQANSDKYLTILAPTLYQWIPNIYFNIFSTIGLIIAATVILIFSFTIYKIKFKISKENIIHIALISVIMMPFFLPKMHERYFFLADVISIIFAFYYPRFSFIPVSIILSSLLCYYPANKGYEIFPISYLSFVILSVLITLIIHLYHTINLQNKTIDNIKLQVELEEK